MARSTTEKQVLELLTGSADRSQNLLERELVQGALIQQGSPSME